MPLKWKALCSVALIALSIEAWSQIQDKPSGIDTLFRCGDADGHIQISSTASGAVKAESYLNGIVEFGDNPSVLIGSLHLRNEKSRCLVELRTGLGSRKFILSGKVFAMDLPGKLPVPCTIFEPGRHSIVNCGHPGPNFALSSNSDLTCLPAADESQDFGLNAKLENLLLVGGLRNYLPMEGRLKNPKFSDLPFKKLEAPAGEKSGCAFQMDREGFPRATLFVSDTSTGAYRSAKVIYGEGKENERRLNCRVSEELISKHSCLKHPASSGERSISRRRASGL